MKKLRCKPIRQKDPMNLNGGVLEAVGGVKRLNVKNKVRKLSGSIRKIIEWS